ncbi:MAG: hypothetical protein NXI04_11965 [Planctomycetaceae bacterium]|nr:hypothetical protein [Planctomycetaceae bacterium]
MNPEQLRELEEACEAALAEVAADYLADASEHTPHLMAKAAVTVLEAVLANTVYEEEE